MTKWTPTKQLKWKRRKNLTICEISIKGIHASSLESFQWSTRTMDVAERKFSSWSGTSRVRKGRLAMYLAVQMGVLDLATSPSFKSSLPDDRKRLWWAHLMACAPWILGSNGSHWLKSTDNSKESTKVGGYSHNFRGGLFSSGRLGQAGWINLKTLLGKTFRLFGNQKVPDMGVIGGKIPGLFPWKFIPDD